MEEFQELKEYIDNSLQDCKRRFGIILLSRHETKLKSVLVFSYLYEKHYDVELPDDVFIEIMKDGIGLLGPGDG